MSLSCDSVSALISLLRAGLVSEPPSLGSYPDMNLRTVYLLARRNSVEGVAWHGAKHLVGLMPSELAAEWSASAERVLWRKLQFDVERERVFGALTKARVAHLPLKGSTTSNYYPDPSMRSMVDNDILFGFVESDGDGGCREEGGSGLARGLSMRRASIVVRRVMEGLGYNCDFFLDWNNDGYVKEPIFNFELHRGLVPPNSPMADYYSEPWERAFALGDGTDFEYRFRPEDEYLYHVAHAFTNSINVGLNARAVCDEIVLIRHFGDSLDWDYVLSELPKMARGVPELEAKLRLGALESFGTDAERTSYRFDDGSFSDENRGFLRSILLSGGRMKSPLVSSSGTVSEELGHAWKRLVMEPLGRRFECPVLGSTQLLFPGFLVHRLKKAFRIAHEDHIHQGF